MKFAGLIIVSIVLGVLVQGILLDLIYIPTGRLSLLPYPVTGFSAQGIPIPVPVQVTAQFIVFVVPFLVTMTAVTVATIAQPWSRFVAILLLALTGATLMHTILFEGGYLFIYPTAVLNLLMTSTMQSLPAVFFTVTMACLVRFLLGLLDMLRRRT